MPCLAVVVKVNILSLIVWAAPELKSTAISLVALKEKWTVGLCFLKILCEVCQLRWLLNIPVAPGSWGHSAVIPNQVVCLCGQWAMAYFSFPVYFRLSCTVFSIPFYLKNNELQCYCAEKKSGWFPIKARWLRQAGPVWGRGTAKVQVLQTV